MFKIGDFSRFTRVSVKTLRHYDEVGLLRPRVVDRFTNYRYYSADQVPRLNQILALRELGFSLEQIGRLLEAELSPEQLSGMFAGKRAEIEARIRAETEQLARVDAYLAQMGTEESPRYDVVLRSIAPGLVATLRTWVASDAENAADEEDQTAALFDEVELHVARFKARAALPPLIIYHDREYRADGQDLEIVIPLTSAVEATERIQVYELPGCETMACLIHTGGYEHLSQTFSTLLQWIERNAYVIDGPTRASFLRFGADQEGYALPESYIATQAHELVTELQVPVVRSQEGNHEGEQTIFGDV